MTKKEFIERYYEKESFKSKALSERILNDLLASFEEALISGEEVNFIGWGKFEVIERSARECRNPRTGEVMQISARKSVKFKASKKLNEAVK